MKLCPLSPTLKNMALYGSSIVLMKGVSLFMLPFIANHISQHELGRLELLSTFAMILSVVLGFSLHEALYRFAGTEQDPHKKRRITGEIFTLTMIVGAISLPIIWILSPFFSEWKPEYANTIELELLLMPLAFEGMIAVVLASLRMREKAKLFFYLTTGRALLQALLTVVVLYQGYGITAILLAGFMSAALQIFALVYLQTKQNKKVRGTGFIFNKEITSLCIPYCLPLMTSGLVAFGLNGFERWVLAENTSLSDLALYAVALKFALALTLLMQPFCMWWMPKRFDYLQSQGKEITAKMTQSSLVLLCGLTILICYLAPLLIEWLMPASYQQAKTIAIALIIVSAIKELNELINLGALAEKQTKKLLWINSFATGLGMIAILVLTPIYGMSGVISSLILAQTIRVILTFILSQSAHPLPYSLGKLSILLLITSVSIALSLSSFSVGIQLMMAALCTTSVVILASQLQLVTLPKSEQGEKCL
ncbi:oligosaccharide flippase family protein [Aliivibrio sp. S3MY1]|uniref:lipopolysaccharide biosynthesis protein n=1 Tax=unclassified Aliivibrio TaxID=2645654 RepID=UPI0023790467|nr:MULTISPECIES: oligosaccharide flippase family protein [unclassified Aliivibrio]MDD9194448.1 oligosaccharide flippase family protein [Aliivibrio sp. S3MY1]MDD9198213.1 oligosaccharide flippase family protein [Aliivibrio sp. S2MY1]